MKNHFLVTIVDAKEYFEYTPGVLRAYVHPSHLNSLTFTLYPVIDGRMGCKFIWGEVLSLSGADRTATIKPMFSQENEVIDFDFCVIAAGCNFGMFHPMGESLWFPTIHAKAIPVSDWPHIDERFIEGRRRHIMEEYQNIGGLNEKEAKILVVGAGFIGVEWVTELQHYFPKLKLTICDMLPQCLGPLPARAANYCSRYMTKHGIKQFYQTGFDKDNDQFWKKIELPDKADKIYVCVGVKSSNYFMPPETLSERGGWIMMDVTLGVTNREGKLWSADDKGYARIYAVGDCNYGGLVDDPSKPRGDWVIPPIPKISYPGEEEALIATRNIEKIDKIVFRGIETDNFGNKLAPSPMHWPWGAGMFATSLGAKDACFVAGANWEKNSGIMCVWGRPCAWQKWIIEWSKVDECAYGVIGRLIWHFVHHTPVHLFGGGPLWGY